MAQSQASHREDSETYVPAGVIPIQEIGKRCSGTPENGVGHGQPGDPMFTIQATAQHGVFVPHHDEHDGRGANFQSADILPAVRGPNGTDNPLVAHSLTAEGHDASEDGTGRGVPLVSQYISTRNERYDAETQDFIPVAFTERTRADGRNLESQENLAYAVTNPGSGGRTHSRQLYDGNYGVRRLTPTEVERLFGFPDGWTAIAYRGKPACDGPRYRALGNSMAVPLLTWLGRRIELVASLKP